ncbi:uncharacterized protein Dwil_GK23860 [Drosophila willistoni]|uniref:Uncharacterized protein n=1 Tax=Drosophila willistoni TaxID=7260 RepID=B4MTK1_DROWI|nr:uncharacterized protein Dwil_GK23860 [Drosophila willistoni]
MAAAQSAYARLLDLSMRSPSDLNSRIINKFCTALGELRQLVACVVCCKLLVDPYYPKGHRCDHFVCRLCVRGKKRLNPICPKCNDCSDYKIYVEDRAMTLQLLCYKTLCVQILQSGLYSHLVNQKIEVTSNINKPRIKLPSKSVQEFIVEGSEYDDIRDIFLFEPGPSALKDSVSALPDESPNISKANTPELPFAQALPEQMSISDMEIEMEAATAEHHHFGSPIPLLPTGSRVGLQRQVLVTQAEPQSLITPNWSELNFSSGLNSVTNLREGTYTYVLPDPSDASFVATDSSLLIGQLVQIDNTSDLDPDQVLVQNESVVVTIPKTTAIISHKEKPHPVAAATNEKPHASAAANEKPRPCAAAAKAKPNPTAAAATNEKPYASAAVNEKPHPSAAVNEKPHPFAAAAKAKPNPVATAAKERPVTAASKEMSVPASKQKPVAAKPKESSDTLVPVKPVNTAAAKEKTLPPPPPAAAAKEKTIPPPPPAAAAKEKTIPPPPPAAAAKEKTLPPPPPTAAAKEKTLPPPPPAAADKEKTIPPPPPAAAAKEKTLPPSPPADAAEEKTLPPPPPADAAKEKTLPPPPHPAAAAAVKQVKKLPVDNKEKEKQSIAVIKKIDIASKGKSAEKLPKEKQDDKLEAFKNQLAAAVKERVNKKKPAMAVTKEKQDKRLPAAAVTPVKKAEEHVVTPKRKHAQLMEEEKSISSHTRFRKQTATIVSSVQVQPPAKEESPKRQPVSVVTKSSASKAKKTAAADPKQRKHCRCGISGPSTPKTCRNNRCWCYINGNSCTDCSCQGCNNPHKQDYIDTDDEMDDDDDDDEDDDETLANLKTDIIALKGEKKNRSFEGLTLVALSNPEQSQHPLVLVQNENNEMQCFNIFQGDVPIDPANYGFQRVQLQNKDSGNNSIPQYAYMAMPPDLLDQAVSGDGQSHVDSSSFSPEIKKFKNIDPNEDACPGDSLTATETAHSLFEDIMSGSDDL